MMQTVIDEISAPARFALAAGFVMLAFMPVNTEFGISNPMIQAAMNATDVIIAIVLLR